MQWFSVSATISAPHAEITTDTGLQNCTVAPDSEATRIDEDASDNPEISGSPAIPGTLRSDDNECILSNALVASASIKGSSEGELFLFRGACKSTYRP